MRSPRAGLVLSAAIVAALQIGFSGVAQAAAPPAPAPPVVPTPPAPTAPTYICDNINAVQPGVFGYTNCEAFGGMPNSAYFTHGESYTLIPRMPDSTGYVQRYRCYGGAVDAPTSVAPARCSELGPRTPAAQASPTVPYGGPGGPGH